jgi:hypothetical protein
MIRFFLRLFCAHRGGIKVVTEKHYAPGCTYETTLKRIECRACGKVLCDENVLEEYDHIMEASNADED